MRASRQLLVRVTAPAVAVGFVLLGASVLGIQSVNRLEAQQAAVLAKNVSSLRAAQQLELQLRQLRFHSLMLALDPGLDRRRRLVEDDQHAFEKAFQVVQATATSPDEKSLVQEIERGYRQYRAELAQAEPVPPTAGRGDILQWADAHPVHRLIDPCEQLLKVNGEEMEATVREGAALSDQTRMTLLVLGVLGPVGGVIGGFGVAWGLGRSITRLSVRLQDVHAHLDRELGTVRLAAEGGDLQQIDRQLSHVVERVRQVVEQLQQQQREGLRAEQLSAVGQLAAGMAHEVRNPLTSIKLLVGAALKAGPSRPLSPEDLQVIHDEVGRLERKVQALLDFAKPPETVRHRSDVVELIGKAVELVGGRLRQQKVRLETDFPAQPVTAELDRDQFSGVLINLFLNALDAMPHGGCLDVTLAEEAGGTLRLTVADTGPGFDPTVAGRIFTPFTSTKPTGTGLGLSVSRRVVRDHGGTITAADRPGGGACFTITLPACAGELRHADLVGR